MHVLVVLQASDGRAARAVPHDDEAVHRAEDHEAPIVVEGNAAHFVGVGQQKLGVTIADAPEADVAVAAGGGEQAGVLGDGDSVDVVWMRQMHQNGARWDTVILDPPKLVQGDEEEQRLGWQKYEDMNRLGASLVEPGGILVTCSCSGLVTMEAFENLVVRSVHQ